MGFYERLGVRPLINAATTFTAIGGSLMPPEVLDAMRDAAGSFVDMHELHLAAGRRLAELTRNEAGYVAPGCAAAMVLALLGIRTGGRPDGLSQLPGRDEAPYEVVMHAAHRIPYDTTLALAGIRVRQIGNVIQTFEWELEAAITERTAAVLYVAGSHLPDVALPLPTVVRIARERGVPVLVDAAAQLPPASNLWRFTRELGADLVAFSGGKALRGPQASGLLLGRADLVEAARRSGAPFQSWGRALKAGKEEIAGLVRAVELFVARDEAWLEREQRAVLEDWRGIALGAEGVHAELEDANEAGQPVPRLRIELDDPERAAAALAAFDGFRPRVAVLPYRVQGSPRGFWLGADQLAPGDERVVAAALEHALSIHPDIHPDEGDRS
ncbi:aminotransferase class V-fold PLP-dependent enzyme [Pseudolysinimonas kribbensis]|uniref:aminotransferase class V-fold PLP-dependent enzyme n=1 Tax=Pseudolysinimonas kribbensis TaxID=433641 RepID=UPI0031E05470